jgi:hypothetical protein
LKVLAPKKNFTGFNTEIIEKTSEIFQGKVNWKKRTKLVMDMYLVKYLLSWHMMKFVVKRIKMIYS